MGYNSAMMKSLGKRLKTQTLAANQHLVQTANNAYDRLFRSEQLIKSAQTPFEVIHSDGLMSVRVSNSLSMDQEALKATSVAIEGTREYLELEHLLEDLCRQTRTSGTPWLQV